MENLIFMANASKAYKAELVYYTEHVIKLTFENEIPDEKIVTSGFFIANEHNLENMTGKKYIDFKTIWYQADMEIDLSDDGSQYVEPTIVETLEEVRTKKIAELSDDCYKSIVYGTDIKMSDGNTKHFSYSIEDQSNIKELFDVAAVMHMPQYYHADNEGCQMYSEYDITQIYLTNSLNKMSSITYFNQIKMYIDTLNNIDQIKAIKWGDPLIGEYLKTYREALENEEEIIRKMIGE